MVSQKVKIRSAPNEINSEYSIKEYKFLAKLIMLYWGLNFIMEQIFTCQMLGKIYVKNFLSALVAIS